MYSSTGKPVMGFSTHPTENEVLFRPDTKFKVLNVSEKDGINYYVMKEVGKSGDSETEKKQDEEILAKALATRKPAADPSSPFGFGSSSFDGDTFSCPLDESKEIPKVIHQEKIPQMPMFE
jgi:hypothetical protein